MKFFADTAEIADIRELNDAGLLDGVTTNPSLIHKSGRDFMEVTREICGIVDGPVSAEVVALDHDTMMKEAEVLRKIADNVCIKVPLTIDGLKTCRALSSDGTMVNVTLCFSANQALLAAKAGATTGEWAATMREVFGPYRAPTGVDGASAPGEREHGLVVTLALCSFTRLESHTQRSRVPGHATERTAPPDVRSGRRS